MHDTVKIYILSMHYKLVSRLATLSHDYSYSNGRKNDPHPHHRPSRHSFGDLYKVSADITTAQLVSFQYFFEGGGGSGGGGILKGGPGQSLSHVCPGPLVAVFSCTSSPILTGRPRICYLLS